MPFLRYRGSQTRDLKPHTARAVSQTRAAYAARATIARARVADQ